MNITDVEDKTIRGAREAAVPLREFTEQFKQAFFEDARTLRIKRANEYPEATDQRHIDRMIEMISALISKGLAYQADDKSVYFRINKFPGYESSRTSICHNSNRQGVKHDEYDKEHIGDFALWKAWDEEDGDVKWDSPWGRAGLAGILNAAQCPRRYSGIRSISTAAASTIFSAPRSRDRSERRRHWGKVCPLLVTLRAPAGGRPKDGEIPGQLLYRSRCFGEGLRRPGATVRIIAGSLPGTAEFHLGGNERGAGVTCPHR